MTGDGVTPWFLEAALRGCGAVLWGELSLSLELIPRLVTAPGSDLTCRLISRDPVTKVLLLEREWEGDVMAGENPKVVEGRGAWAPLRAAGGVGLLLNPRSSPGSPGMGARSGGLSPMEGKLFLLLLHLAVPKPSGVVVPRSSLSRASPCPINAWKCRKSILKGWGSPGEGCGKPRGGVGAPRALQPCRRSLMVRRSWCKSLPGQGRGKQGTGWRQGSRQRGGGWRGLKHSGITCPPDVGTNLLQERTRGRWF